MRTNHPQRAEAVQPAGVPNTPNPASRPARQRWPASWARSPLRADACSDLQGDLNARLRGLHNGSCGTACLLVFAAITRTEKGRQAPVATNTRSHRPSERDASLVVNSAPRLQHCSVFAWTGSAWSSHVASADGAQTSGRTNYTQTSPQLVSLGSLCSPRVCLPLTVEFLLL